MSHNDPPQYQYGGNLPNQDWFTPKEVGGYMGRCATTIIRWIKKRRLKATLIERLYYISREELLRFLNGGGGPKE